MNEDPPCGSEPPCQMGAQCRKTPLGEDKCDCNTAFPGWGETSCSVQNCRVNTDFETSERESKHFQQLHVNETTNSCICPDGWSGAGCRMCTTDYACNNRFSEFLKDKNGTMRCDKSMVVWNNINSKDFNCLIEDEFITQLVGGKVKLNMGCMNLSIHDTNSTNSGECLMVGYSDYGYPPPKTPLFEDLSKVNLQNLRSSYHSEETSHSTFSHELSENRLRDIVIPSGYLTTIFYCSFSSCSASIDNDHKFVKYSCDVAKCRATEKYPVSDVFKLMLEAAKTTSAMTCDMETSLCEISQVEMGWSNLKLSCSAGECLYGDHPFPPIKPKNWITEISIAGALGLFLLAAFFINMAYGIYSRIQDKKKHDVWMKENVNGADMFSFENISYSLPLLDAAKNKCLPVKKTILHNVSGSVKRGEILAIMGSSGAGKTTLLDILGARRKSGYVQGDILIDGKYVDHDYKRKIGYVTQEIQLMGTMTVRECLEFSANLRLPRNVSEEEKRRRVDDALRDLGITHIADRRIGTALRRGISGGEKRRVNIACELVISPTVLFLDEPTTGLDSYNALVVVKCLKALAEKGKIIVMSIHQPRYNIFNMFDNLLLLSEGQTVYFGPAHDAVSYFEGLGYTCGKNTNPADFLLDVVISAALNQKRNLTLPQALQAEDSNELTKLVTHYRSVSGSMESDKLSDIANSLNNEDGWRPNEANKPTERSLLLSPKVNPQKYPRNIFGMRKSSALVAMHGDTQSTSFYSQFYYLSGRTIKNFFRNFMLLPLHLLTAILMATFIGLCFWRLPMTIPVGLQNRMGAMFFTCALLGLTCMSSLELFISERAIFIAERANRYYGSWAYYTSKVLFDVIPLRVIPPIIFGSISYFMIGLRYDGNIYYFLDYLLILVLFNVTCGGITLTVGIVSPTVATGNMITILLLFYFMLFGGFLLNNDNIPWYLAPLRFTSPFQYALEAMITNELAGQVVEVEVKNVGGVTKLPGDIVLQNFGFSSSHFSLDMGVLIGSSIAFLIIPGFLLYYFVKERR